MRWNKCFRIRYDRQVQAMFLYLLTINVFNFWIYILYNAGVSPILQYVNSLSLYLLLYVWMIPFVMYLFRRIKLTILWYVACLFAFFFISSLRPNCLWGMQYNNYALWIWGTSVPSVILINYVSLDNAFNTRMNHFARIVGTIIIPIYILSTYVIANRLSPEYYMFFSSGAAVVAAILMVFALDRKSLIDILLTLVLAFLILSGGARSNFIQIFAVVCIYFVLQKKSGKITLLLLLFLAFYLIVDLYADRLLQFATLNESRTLRFLLSGNFMETNRMEYYRRSLEYLRDQSLSVQLFGLGLGGERQFIVNRLTDAGYVHQIFIEMILQFGYIGGSIVIVLFVGLSAFTIYQIRKTQKYVLIASILCAQLVPLLVSSSYIATSSFHIWMGFCIRVIWEYRHPAGSKKEMVGIR